MLSALRRFRNPLRAVTLLATVGLLAGCQLPAVGGGSGPSVRGQTIQVAMLLPVGSGQGGDALISRNLENAARMAAAEFGNVPMEITVYDTAGQAARAASLAQQAVSGGADVIVGPLRSDAVAAVGVALAGQDVSVLGFSNNTEVAGGNVIVLGYTFENSAARIVRYSAAQGRSRLVLAHAQNLAGEVARDAVLNAAANSSASIVATVPYEFSQAGVTNAAPQILSAARSTGAHGVLLTADSAGALPFFARLLPENGFDPNAVRLMGLTRWDRPASTAQLPGLQGAWFPVPDPNASAAFNARYQQNFGAAPHLLAGLGYDAIRAIGETAQRRGALGIADFTSSSGFAGANGAFRVNGNGTNRRALAIAQILNNQVVVIDPAPRRLGGLGF